MWNDTITDQWHKLQSWTFGQGDHVDIVHQKKKSHFSLISVKLFL